MLKTICKFEINCIFFITQNKIELLINIHNTNLTMTDQKFTQQEILGIQFEN